MKLFEIGNGLKSIKLPNSYFASCEEDDTMRLYKFDVPDISIQFTLSPARLQESENTFNISPSSKTNDTSKFNTTDPQSTKNDEWSLMKSAEGLHTYGMETLISDSLLIMHIVLPSDYEKNNVSVVSSIKKEMTSAIDTIASVEDGKAWIFEPREENFSAIRKHVSAILNIAENELEAYHSSNKTLIHLQKLLDNTSFTVENRSELQSLGIALGDYLQHKNEDFHWVVLRESATRHYCLQFQNLGLTVIPRKMLEHYIGQTQQIDLVDLLSALVEQMEAMVESEQFIQTDADF